MPLSLQNQNTSAGTSFRKQTHI